uniref:Uncharacterized protein n=1 Tax=Prymnesium polylepis TaxID=72548 RepID=A0A7S4M933_9EUKA|mmetsp:Transcript_2166/g.4721  ORF Transcript_2166/g.4721 Transcript_2166/m.4721 type:complete len:209 (+) Transcript_2166:287-913(+)
MHLSAPRPRTDTTFTRRTPRTRERRVANVHGNAPAPSPQTRKPTTLTTRDAHPPCHGDYVEMPRFPLESHTRAHHTHTRTQRFNATADCLDPSHSHKSTHCIGKAKRTLQPFCLVAARGRQPIALPVLDVVLLHAKVGVGDLLGFALQPVRQERVVPRGVAPDEARLFRLVLRLDHRRVPEEDEVGRRAQETRAHRRSCRRHRFRVLA